MFILIYFINFNFKKNIFIGYFNINTNLISVNNNIKFTVLKFFDNGFVTSKSTSFILLFFFLVFNFFGDYLFLLIINYVSQIEAYFNKDSINTFKYYYSTNFANTSVFKNLYLIVILINIISLKILLTNYYKNITNF